MTSNESSRKKTKIIRERGFFAGLFAGLVHGFMQLVMAFAIGTGASAIVCWYYSVPLALSLVGGFIVLGLAVALMSEGSIF